MCSRVVSFRVTAEVRCIFAVLPRGSMRTCKPLCHYLKSKTVERIPVVDETPPSDEALGWVTPSHHKVSLAPIHARTYMHMHMDMCMHMPMHMCAAAPQLRRLGLLSFRVCSCTQSDHGHYT